MYNIFAKETSLPKSGNISPFSVKSHLLYHTFSKKSTKTHVFFLPFFTKLFHFGIFIQKQLFLCKTAVFRLFFFPTLHSNGKTVSVGNGSDITVIITAVHFNSLGI